MNTNATRASTARWLRGIDDAGPCWGTLWRLGSKIKIKIKMSKSERMDGH